ncbi:hypothetical protein J1TS1_13440 [Shouchella clausii]|uniref:sporulation inhibitor of replication protein SirA n=1 Tax=Shouchella TaxID=2893057 RepID=UPI000BA57C49|nr:MULTISPECIES: sporulation inhibitor of replication protein SirA [Shouchella]MCM3380214.1 sporulation inhibitor of replication protein SirA [Shouchella rhizosphaerae]MDO7282467.1 sporulation inhibitor of replication protein SirA [Shouchella clausii]MDO7302562.1 sporulation inhibitor of replication protein SirA [Shouchella clausii]PAE85466.1 hypothetical protein CHH77_01775 [Shouchella clausii]GIN07199.1 hypothetical protein J1TS1_13440 [Shouchella clausii]
MRHYELYLLSDEVAASFSGKEAKLFQLFTERAKAKQSERHIYDRQVDYITKPLPKAKLHKALQKRYGLKKGNGYELRSAFNERNRCLVELGDKSIQLEALGDLSAETTVFDVLKEVDSHFFAVNVADGRFGWLQPFEKQRVL